MSETTDQALETMLEDGVLAAIALRVVIEPNGDVCLDSNFAVDGGVPDAGAQLLQAIAQSLPGIASELGVDATAAGVHVFVKTAGQG